MAVSNAQSVQLSGGKYSGGTAAITIVSQSSPLTLGGLLAQDDDTRYAYFDESGTTPFKGVLGDKSLTGTVTVQKCQHTGEGVCAYVHNENATTHQQTCLACGLAEAAADCTYSDDYGHDETNHWQTCTLCGGKKTEAHSWGYRWASTTSTIRRSCDKCEIGTAVGTVSVTPDFSVAYGETGSATLACTAELAEGYCLEPEDGEANCWYLTALSGSQSWSLGRDLQVQLPDDLPAGEYRYSASPRLSYQGDIIVGSNISIFGNVTVTPALLTVTGAAAKDRTYDGTNSVQITGVTLDGVLNSDNVSVDLTGLTGTLSGSDAGTYTGVTLPRLTLIGGAAFNYTLPQSMSAVPASVTISKAPLTVTGVTIKTRPYKPTYHTAEVSGVTFTGLVNGETLALGQDYTAFGNYDDPNAGENKSATILVELKSSAKANNYTLPKDSSVNATGTITKVDSSITKAPTATGITYGQALSDSALTDGAGSVAGSFSWTAPATKPSAGTAQFEVTFTPTDMNYNTATVNVSVTVAKATSTASPYSGSFTDTYVGRNGTSYNSTTPPTNAGDYTVIISLTDTNTYIGSLSLDFTISKASITITADDKQADVGTAKPALTYTVTGLVGADTLATAPTLACDADMDTIGQYPITASGAAVPATGNYNTAITYVAGTLAVTDPTIAVTGVTLNKTSTTLTVGGSERLTATVAPGDATDKAVTWASSNTAVATVDASGNVTAVSAGTATITVTTADGGKTAICTVTVRSNSGGVGYVPSPSNPSNSTVRNCRKIIA